MLPFIIAVLIFLIAVAVVFLLNRTEDPEDNQSENSVK
jgi:hypothetical protein